MSNRWNIVPETFRSRPGELPRDGRERIVSDTFSAFEKSQRPDNRFLVAGLLVVLLLAGAIGGGLGGGLAVQKGNCATAAADVSITTATVTITTTMPEATSPNPSLPEPTSAEVETTEATSPIAPPCNSSQPYTPLNPSSQNSTYIINGTILTYTLLCSQNLPTDQAPNPLLTDIQEIYYNDMPSIYTCIDACALYNHQIPSVAFSNSRGINVAFGPEVLCSAVSLGPGPGDTQGSCLLKTKNKEGPRISGDRDQRFQSAVLNWPDR